MLQRSLEPGMRFETDWRSLAIALMIVPLLPAIGAEKDPRSTRLDAMVTKATRPDQPGLAILVKKDGHILFERGYGVRKFGGGAPITPDTDFRLASVTKQFTAMAVMLLVNEGNLNYNTALTEIFPEFPGYGKAITVRHLLTHTSGLPDYEDLMELAEKAGGQRWSAARQITDAEVLALLEGEKRGRFAPGTS
jgi:CubicO group peptidase (beta-lactamase class C family)